MNKFTFEEFKKWAEIDTDKDLSILYLVVDLTEKLKDETFYWLSAEGDLSEPERFAYDTIETITEIRPEDEIWESKEGEETYRFYYLDEEDKEVLKDLPFLRDNKVPKITAIISVRIPGMEDFILIEET